ncbi:hypothetical protein FDP41_006951 [Naegleria fowleri]|uniref:RecQ-mediated genome instability protein 1 n=1 Tax=Naegleria fowleri TaxID=5763 RepID=A0A6A5BJ36_NAEFO|nr:uncharacterized protein FDP41_006951 [Naegleria fowleri]KAF0974020.1 hypothetical protein FDP41_006951 [Naegleria fowleri]CAG4718657.1 unnamed protein product [Naegleria fowleri]
MQSQIKSYLLSEKIYILDDWLEQCIQFVESEEPYLRNNLAGMKDSVFKQFLVSDYDKIAQKPSPNYSLFSNLEQEHGKILKGPFVLQINDIWDIGIPMTDQIDMDKELVDTSNEEMEEGDLLFSDALQTEIQGAKPKKDYTNSNYSRRLLKFALSDGHVNNIQAIEYKPLDSISLKTELGTKVKISNVLVRRGILLLIPQSITVLGGGVDELIEAKKIFKSNLASKLSGKLELKKQIESNINTIKNNRQATNNANSTRGSPNQTRQTSNVKTEEFDDELILLDDDENIIDCSDDETEIYQDHKRSKKR